MALAIGLKIKKSLTNSQFELREAREPRQTPSRRLQALVGEHAQRQRQQTPVSHQEILCVLGNICNSETPDKESFSHVAKFYNIDGEILEAEQKMYASFRQEFGLGFTTVSD